MKTNWLLFVVTACCATILAWGQEPEVLPLEAEPHHHLALRNQYVKLYQVEVAPHDAVKLHRHDTDAISLSLSESLVTVHSPRKPDVQQKLAYGQIRLQSQGYVHSTSVEGETPFRNVTVELLRPQTRERNGCAQVIASEPLHCQGPHPGLAPGVPQFETDQTLVGLLLVKAKERVVIGEPTRATLIVALDSGATHSGENGRVSLLRSGDFVWLEGGKSAFRNESAAEVRLVCFAFAPTERAPKTGK